MNPVISVIVANYNGGRYLAEALRSILAQSFKPLELLLVDDMSTDSSLEIAESFAADDARLRIIQLGSNRGPAAARNAGLRAARGAWISIVDSDDFIHPERLGRLLEIAERDEADIVADDQLVFDDAQPRGAKRMLRGARAAAPSWISAAEYVDENRLFASGACLGYLKPLIRARLLTQHGIAYHEGLKNAEDYDLILRLLVRGARFRLVPEMLYFYRRHNMSISHRLSATALPAMATADDQFRHWAGPEAVAPLRAALDERRASIATAQAVETAILQIKSRRPLRAIASLAARPSAIAIVARLALLARLRRGGSAPQAPKPVICVLSRQRLIAGSNGSTEYLLSICRSLATNGFRLQLVCPTPAMLGRVPVLRVAGTNDVFGEVHIRGTWRLGGVFIARNPMLFIAAAMGVADRLARRLGIRALSALARPAPYAVGVAWAQEDFLYVAQATGGRADFVLADYGFLTPGIGFAARPGAASAVLMHDLFSSRKAGFAAIGSADSVSALEGPQEAALLAQAGLVIAIQAEEAIAVRAMLPRGHAITIAPMAVPTAPNPQPGQGGGLLFVGSSTAPNVDAMKWFLAEIWPLVRKATPLVKLNVAGTVCDRIGSPPPGVAMLGRVKDLAPLYQRADVVISPLRAGSGLKIKLVEAMAHGKPVVATRLAAQGVAEMIAGAVALADAPAEFANAITRLLNDPRERAARAQAALDIASREFSPQSAYGDVIKYFKGSKRFFFEKKNQKTFAPGATGVGNLGAKFLCGASRPDDRALARSESGRAAMVQKSDRLIEPPFVTIVVPALNEARYIEACLTSLVAQCVPGRHEIIVMDGGSADATRAIVAAFGVNHPSVVLFNNPKRLQSAAVNLGSRLASAHSTIMIRADAHAHYSPDFIHSCVSALSQTGVTSVVVPMRTVALPGAFLQRAIAAAQSSRLGNGGSAHRTRAVSGFVEHGHHAAFNLSFFRALGGYDESFTHNEDAELDVRARAAGGGVWMCAEEPVLYYPRDRLDRLALQYYRHGGGRARTLRKHHLTPKLRQVVPLGALAGCIAGVAAAPFAPADASVALCYPAACIAWGITQGIRRRDPALLFSGLALMTMHLSWAVGFLAANLPGFAVPRLAKPVLQSLQAAPALRRDATRGVEPR